MFVRQDGDQPGAGAEGAFGGEHGGSVVAEAAGDDGEVTESALVAVGRSAGREAEQVLAGGPDLIAGGYRGLEAQRVS
jgi:hypothetical protein